MHPFATRFMLSLDADPDDKPNGCTLFDFKTKKHVKFKEDESDFPKKLYSTLEDPGESVEAHNAAASDLLTLFNARLKGGDDAAIAARGFYGV